MKDAYWARFFQKSDGGYYADLPDLPGCATEGPSVEQVYNCLVNEAIPLWLEDQPWPSARGADQILAAPRPEWHRTSCPQGGPPVEGGVRPVSGFQRHQAWGGEGRPLMLVRISISEVGGPAVGTWSNRSMDADYVRRRPLNH